MKKYKSLALLFIAVMLSATAGYMAMKYLERREQALIAEFDEKANYTEVIVPNRNLRVGDPISVETVSVRPVPATYIPSGALYPDDFEAIAGLTVKEPVPAGRPLLRSQLDGLTGIEKFSQLLEPGQRAITLPIDQVESFENMLMPGDRVDILVKMKSGDVKGGVNISSLLGNVLVLATGIFTVADPQYFQAQAVQEGYGSITIGVGSNDVAKIISANEVGDLVYLLRSPVDDGRGRFGQAVGVYGSGVSEAVKVYSKSNVIGGLLGVTYQTSSSITDNRWGSEDEPGRLYKKFEGRSEAADKELQTNAGYR